MATTVLGKRSRCTDDSHLPTRSKRRAQSISEQTNAPAFKIVDDEYDSNEIVIQTRASRRVVAAPKAGAKHNLYATSSPSKPELIVLDDEDVPQDENSIQQVSTPHTTRYHDALSQKILQTPRHRVQVTGRPSTPRTPRTPSTPSNSINSVFATAKKAFSRGSQPVAIVGRDNERAELENFVKERVASGKGASLYVSGPPGTGKSALVTQTCAQFENTHDIRYAYVNCMSIKVATDIYRLTASALGLSDDVFEANSKDIMQRESSNKERKTLLLIVLDEIDQILSLDNEVLYNLFEWSLSKTSRIILVGISNALDLTDRFLPRLKARNTKPKLLPFLPYSVAEIASVLSARARSLLPADTTAAADFVPFLSPMAIQLISKKVAAQTGDLRKAFDIAQRTVELLDIEIRDKYAQQAATEQQQSALTPSRSPLGKITNLSSPETMYSDSPTSTTNSLKTLNSLLSQLTAETAPRATPAHVVRVTSAAFNNGTLQRLKGLNLQQKAILCSLLALEQNAIQACSLPSPPTPSAKKSESGAPTIRAVFTAYSSLCRRDNVLHPLSNTEFRDVIASLETQSLVAAVDGKGGSFSTQIATPSRRGRGGFGASTVDDRRIKACVGVKDVEVMVEGVGSEVLKMILSGQALV